MRKNKVSIIMGIYNCALTLSESIESILSQSYTNWELILCDDGSEDQTLEIARSYARKRPKQIIVIQNETNLGLNATLNKCLKIATGEYIARQDGDDLSLKERFRKEVQFLDTHEEYAFVSSSMIFFDETGNWGRWINPEKPDKKTFLHTTPCFCHAPCMIRKEAFLHINGYTEDKRFLRCEDMNLWYKLYAKGYKGYNLQEPLYMMRDDRNAYKRRTIKNRLNIIYTDWDGMKQLECKWYEYIFFIKKALRCLVVAVLPESIYMILHKRRLKSSIEN